MKNKKAIIILTVLILLFLIGGVSASNVNTTQEISASGTDDVTGAVDVDLDENYDHDINTRKVSVNGTENVFNTVNVNSDTKIHKIDLVDESTDLHELEILNSSYADNSTLQDNSDNSLKENILGSSNSNNELLSSCTPVSFNDVSESISQSFVIVDFPSQTKLKITYYNLVSRIASETISLYGSIGSNSINEQWGTSNYRRYNGNRYLYSGSYEIDLEFTVKKDDKVSINIQVSSRGNIDNYLGSIDINFYIYDAYYNVTVDDISCIKGNTFKVTGTYSDIFSISQSKQVGAYILDDGREMNTVFSGGTITSGNIYSTTFNLGSYICVFNKDTYYGFGLFRFTVTKITPTVSFDNNPTITYASSGTYSISGKVKSGSTNVNEGTVTLKQGNTNLGTATVSNGAWTVSNIPYNKFKPDSYSLTAEYSGGNTYNSATGSSTLTVNKGTPAIAVTTGPTITYAGDKYAVTGTCNVNGLTVTLKQDNIILGVATVSNGAWTISDIDSTLVNPSSSSLTITATSTSTDYWNSKSSTNTMKVNYITPSLSVESTRTYYGSTTMPVIQGNVKSTIGNYYSGKLDLYINDVLVESDVNVNSDGSWSYTMTSSTDFAPRTYSIKTYYKGSTYASSMTETFSSKYTVLQNTPVLTSNTPSGLYGQSDMIRVYGSVTSTTAVNVYNGFVNVTIGSKLLGVNVPVADDGTWSFTVSSTEFDPDVYDIYIVYSGNPYTINQAASFSDAYTVSAGYILPTVDRDLYIDVGDSEHVYVTVENYMGECISCLTVNLTGTGVDGVLSNITDSEGKVVFTIDSLTRGEYSDWKVNISGNTYYNGISNRIVRTFYVREPLSIIIDSISPTDTIYPEMIKVIGHTDATSPLPIGNVTLVLGGKTVNATFNESGFFTASFIGVKPGNYSNMSCEYIPDNTEYFYRGEKQTVSIQETGMKKC